MSPPKPTYFLTPPRPSPPDGPIRLGAIIPSPTQPDEPLHLPRLPPQTDTSTFTEHNWRGSHTTSSTSHYGIWTSFLECVLGASLDLSTSLAHSTHQSWHAERMTTQTFRPSRAFLEQVVRHQLVQEYITQHRFREKVYIITGVMIASCTRLARDTLRERGVYVHAGVDATAWAGVPISVGPEGSWTRKSETAEASCRADDFVFAYRMREVKVGRKGGVKSDRLFDKGALFNTEIRRKVEEEYEVEVEGLGEEPDADHVELESKEVRQQIGEHGEDEDVVCVLPEPLD